MEWTGVWSSYLLHESRLMVRLLCAVSCKDSQIDQASGTVMLGSNRKYIVFVYTRILSTMKFFVVLGRCLDLRSSCSEDPAAVGVDYPYVINRADFSENFSEQQCRNFETSTTWDSSTTIAVN